MKKFRDYCERNLFRFISLKTIRVMKLTFFLSILTVFQLLATESYSQLTKLTLKLENVTISDALKEIENESEFFFLYSPKLIDVEKRVNIDAKDETIKDILTGIFDEKVKFAAYDRQVILTPNEQADLISKLQQQKIITGTITDKDGGPLTGVNVVVTGTTTGEITDLEGKYSINVPPGSKSLTFTFIGMEPQEVTIGTSTQINITMAESAVGLDEVVVVGYGTQKKVNLTGAVSQVDMNKILGSRPLSSATSALQGSIPGLQITTSSGQPGQASLIRIRGAMSITGGSPLILVDNVPMDIEDLNPTDIETISVLKDAAASSIYGGRAAFGVILITTKKGLINQPLKFNYTNNFVVNTPTNLPILASTMEMLTALKAFGNTAYVTGQDLTTWTNLLTEYQTDPAKYPDGETILDGVIYRLAEEDPYKKFMTNGFEQIHNLSFSGGFEKSSYRVSFGYADDDGIMMTNKDSYKKYNINAYLRNNLTNRLVSTLNILYKNDNQSIPASQANLFGGRFSLGRDVNTGYYISPDGSRTPWLTPNNVIELELPDHAMGEDLRFFEKLEYQIMKGLKVTGEYTFNNTISNSFSSGSKNEYLTLTYNTEPINSESFYQRLHGNTDYHALNLYASYEKEYMGHVLTFLAGTNQELSKYSNFWARKLGLLSSSTPSLALASGTMTNGESFEDYVISGYFSRLNYLYKNKYLLEANIRYDGSSKFPKRDRYGFFPSFSAGWIVTEESFLKPIENIINFMKIRGSWGEIGNQSISNYAYIPSMNTYDALWIDPSTAIRYLTVAPPELVSSSFTWETVRTKNIGIDISFLNRRLNATFDYFNRKTLNMLGPAAELPAVLGASAPQKNVADLESKGWELSIDWRVTQKDFGYSFGINVSDDRGFITKFSNEGGLLSQYYNGYEFGEIWGYETAGFYTVDDFVPGTLDANLMNGTLKEGIPAFYTVIKTNPGDIRFVDLNNDGKISPGTSTLFDPGDRKIIGNSNRRYQFGITGNCFYKNFDFSFLIQGVGKRDVWITNNLFWAYQSNWQLAFYKNQLDYWTPENTDAFYPRTYSAASGNTGISRNIQTKYLSNGAYMRLKSIELGYSLPKSVVEKLSINSTRLFISAENLFKLDHLPNGIDPEISEVSMGKGYPYIRKISFGVNVSF